jgi:hypothetical protein
LKKIYPPREEEEASAMSKDTDSNIRIQLTLGILGFAGVVLTVLATIFGPIIQERLRKTDAPTPTPVGAVSTATLPHTPVPTDTVPPGAPTSTPAPATDTPVPTSTLIPPVALGSDWDQSCVSALWQPFPASYTPTQRGDGCWQSVKIFAANKGSLAFLNSRDGLGTEEVYGLFAPLPDIGTVTITVRLKDLTNADLMMGVYPAQDVTSEGLLIIVPAGDPKKRPLVQKDPTNYKTLQDTVTLEQGNGYTVSFTVDSVSASAEVKPKVLVINSVPIDSTQKWLFIGFKGLANTYRIEGAITSLEIK